MRYESAPRAILIVWIVRFDTKTRKEQVMAKSEITGRRKMRGNSVSHSNIKTKRWQDVNVQKRRVWVPEINRFLRVKLTTRDIRTIDKVGFVAFAKKHGYKIPGIK